MIDKNFKLIMISAMYENGGNTTHRFLDGHPELYVYPFESQLGTKYVNDFLSSLYPVKYRWPVFPDSATVEELYSSIIDEECKIRAKTPFVSKFKDIDFDFSDTDRYLEFKRLLGRAPVTRASIIKAFFMSTFRVWKNYKRTHKEKWYVGYSPIVGVDADKIIGDFGTNVRILHVVRNPYSAYADTKKRAVPLSLAHYLTGWVISQYFARIYSLKYPKQFFIIRFEDMIKNPRNVLGKIMVTLGIHSDKTLEYTSWNRERLKIVYPWGTIVSPTSEQNLKTAKLLSKDEINQITLRSAEYLDYFSYHNIRRKLL